MVLWLDRRAEFEKVFVVEGPLPCEVVLQRDVGRVYATLDLDYSENIGYVFEFKKICSYCAYRHNRLKSWPIACWRKLEKEVV